jgi:hypothetical protein
MSSSMSKPPKFDPEHPSGRIAFDDRGKAVWEWRTETGNFKSDIDTQKVKALQDSSDVKLGQTPNQTPGPGKDPYRTADAPRPPGADAPRRRTLDDMRKLSEEIKRARERRRRE